MTIFDPGPLLQLEADTSSREMVHSWGETYVRMLGGRVERILIAVSTADTEAALDAALSLRVSSIMTGASELAEVATLVVDDLRHEDLPAARGRAAVLPELADRTRAALDGYLHELTGAGQAPTDSIR